MGVGGVCGSGESAPVEVVGAKENVTSVPLEKCTSSDWLTHTTGMVMSSARACGQCVRVCVTHYIHTRT
jgi:hypothetical protein